MKIKHIYWFAYFNLDEPSVRYRAKYPLKFLKKTQNIGFSIVYPGYDFRNLTRFIAVYLEVLFFRKSHSVLVFQKLHTSRIYATALKILLFFRPQNTLYDIDDAEHTRHPIDTIHHFMKRCTFCAAGSQSLVDYIQPFNKNVFLLTSPVIEHGIQKTKREDILTIGWIGYYGAHRESLQQLFFPALLKINFPVKFKLLGAKNQAEVAEIQQYFQQNPLIELELPLHINWQNELSIYEMIKTFDIGVAPLLDTEFNRAKSAFKLKQCLSCGVPVLGSSVGENLRFLEDGVNGYLCDTVGEYYQRLVEVKMMRNVDYERFSERAKGSFGGFCVAGYCANFLNIATLEQKC